MTPEAALAAIRDHADGERAAQAQAYHKVSRTYLGVPNPVLNGLTRDWRKALDGFARVALADALWRSDIFEARLAAAKLLTTARIRPDDGAAWDLIRSWVPQFDSWAIADHACMAGQKRLLQDPARVTQVEAWTGSEHMWTRRAALVITLPWARRLRRSEDLAIRERVLNWAAAYVPDRDWFIQKAVAWWLREVSKHDPRRVHQFLADHGDAMKAFARREAGKYLREL